LLFHDADREIESGFMDLILSRPLARHWIITRSIILMISSPGWCWDDDDGHWLGLNTLAPKDSVWPSRTW